MQAMQAEGCIDNMYDVPYSSSPKLMLSQLTYVSMVLNWGYYRP